MFLRLMLMLLCVAIVPDASAVGRLELTSPDSQFEAVHLDASIRVDVSGMVARGEITETFENDSAHFVHARYLLPLADDAAVDGLELRVGERLIIGEVREREEARTAFAEAARNGHRAALVEQDRANLFRTAVANVPPGERVQITVRWWQKVGFDNGTFSLVMPLTHTPRYAWKDAPSVGSEAPPQLLEAPVGGELRGLSLQLDVRAGLPLARIESPSHPVILMQDARDHYRVELDPVAPLLARDFVLSWQAEPSANPAAALFAEKRADATYALLMLVPPSEMPLALPRELILVIDTSGSMEGDSLNQAVAALQGALSRLRDGDRFNLIQFNSGASALFESAQPVTRDSLEIGHDWLGSLVASGGTEMADALKLALRDRAPPTHVRQVIFATDGAVGNEDQLMGLIAKDLGDSRLFTIGIGSAPNALFMNSAARFGRGSATTVRDLGEVSQQLDTLFAKLDRPALRDLDVVWPAGTEVYPERIPDLYAGEPLLVSAKLKTADGEVEALGWTSAGVWTKRLPLPQQRSDDGIGKLWARARVEALEDALRLGGTLETLRTQIIEVALEHRLVTRFTSLIAIEQQAVRDPSTPAAEAEIANPAPENSALALGQTATSSRLQILIGLFALALAGALGTRGRARNPGELA